MPANAVDSSARLSGGKSRADSGQVNGAALASGDSAVAAGGGPGVQANAGPAPKTKPASGARPEPAAKTAVGTGPKAKTKTKTGPESGFKSGSAPKTNANAKPEPGAGPEPASQTKTGSGAKTDPKPGTAPKTKTGTGGKAKPESAPKARPSAQLSARSPATDMDAVGPELAKKLDRLKIGRVIDLALHFPYRYLDYTQVTPLNQLVAGRAAVIEATVVDVQIKYGRGRSLAVDLEDEFGRVTVRYFRVFPWLTKTFVPGRRVRCFGIPYRFRTLEIGHPRVETLDHGAKPLPEFLTPVYPSTAGLRQNQLIALIDEALEIVGADDDLGYLATEAGAPKWLLDLGQALEGIHHTRNWRQSQDILKKAHPAMRTVIFHDILANLIALEQMRHRLSERPSVAVAYDKAALRELERGWPFELTGAQKKAIGEIAADLSEEHAMLRLLQGDVGSGKTVVAAFAVYLCQLAGQQVAMLAPTEILCEQHLETFGKWFADLPFRVEILTSSLTRKNRNEILRRISAGEVDLVIGTHALFQGDVQFRNLALVVIDEQQRFGVEHRLQLTTSSQQHSDRGVPHQLMMTATPIPRTLATAKLSILDCSVLDQMPSGRSEIRTSIMPDSRRDDLIDRVRQYVAEDKQVFWVSPRIEEGDDSQELQSVKAVEKILAARIGKERVQVVHGRLKAKQRERIIGAFRNEEFPILVATTVVEVGVDIPNATLMVIEHCERLGLSQIHQLRGRVGRGHKVSDCVLLYHEPLSDVSEQRLRAARSTNGFELARKDLELRGAGEFFGTEQSGTLNMRVGNLFRDEKLLTSAHTLAKAYARGPAGRADEIVGLWVGEDTDGLHGAI